MGSGYDPTMSAAWWHTCCLPCLATTRPKRDSQHRYAALAYYRDRRAVLHGLPGTETGWQFKYLVLGQQSMHRLQMTTICVRVRHATARSHVQHCHATGTVRPCMCLPFLRPSPAHVVDKHPASGPRASRPLNLRPTCENTHIHTHTYTHKHMCPCSAVNKGGLCQVALSQVHAHRTVYLALCAHTITHLAVLCVGFDHVVQIRIYCILLP